MNKIVVIIAVLLTLTYGCSKAETDIGSLKNDVETKVSAIIDVADLQ